MRESKRERERKGERGEREREVGAVGSAAASFGLDR